MKKEIKIQNISVNYNDKSIKSLYATKVAFWTGKKLSILGNELDENRLPRFYCKDNGEILFAKVILDDGAADFSKANIIYDNNGNILISFKFINNDNGVVLSIYSTSPLYFEINMPNIHKIQEIAPEKQTGEMIWLILALILGIFYEGCFLSSLFNPLAISLNSYDISFVVTIVCALIMSFFYYICTIGLLKIIDYSKISKQIRELFFRNDKSEK